MFSIPNKYLFKNRIIIIIHFKNYFWNAFLKKQVQRRTRLCLRHLCSNYLAVRCPPQPSSASISRSPCYLSSENENECHREYKWFFGAAKQLIVSQTRQSSVFSLLLVQRDHRVFGDNPSFRFRPYQNYQINLLKLVLKNTKNIYRNLFL